MYTPKAAALFLLCCLQLSLRAQTISFRLVSVRELASPALHSQGRFGGISSIALVPEGLLYPADGRGNILILTSDHYPNRPGGEKQQSYSFPLDTNLAGAQGIPFFGMNNVESVRYNTKLNSIFFSYEDNHTSGVCRVKNSHNATTIDTLFTEDNFYNNRGIEGIAFTAGNNLWISREAGNDAAAGPYIPFHSVPYDSKRNSYDLSRKKEYRYPFDKCICLDSCREFGPSKGNGVSEILAMKNEPGQLLVLERCFDGKTTHVRLYLAQVQAGSSTLSKQLVFDFNRHLVPDNLEGMAWGTGKDEDTLYLVSDDNFNPRQKTLLVKIQMVRK